MLEIHPYNDKKTRQECICLDTALARLAVFRIRTVFIYCLKEHVVQLQ